MNTKASVPKKPGVRAGFLGEIDVPTMAADNMSGVKQAEMTFRMDPKWHGRFKATAALRGISMKDLLIESFAAWEEKHK